jgi:hypothetical protein
MAILEVAIGLSFLYAVLSLVCTSATEGVANLVALRARVLRLAIANLFREVKDGPNTQSLLDHPLVNALWQNRAFKGFIPGLPDYLPSRIFSTALLESVKTTDGEATRTRPSTTEELSALIEKIENEPMKRALKTLTQGAWDVEAAQRKIEQWFDDSMERVRGWYARWAQLITFAVALVIVGGLNADTVMVADMLWRDSSLRATIVQMAEEEAKRTTQPTATAPASTGAAAVPGAPAATGDAGAKPVGGSGKEGLSRRAQHLAAFPLGWSGEAGDPRAIPSQPLELMRKVFGLLATVLAVSLGAPFWFDLINRLVSLRSSGQPPKTEKAQG